MAQILPYILPLLLGRTFDLDKMQVGVDIFSQDIFDKKITIHNPMTETQYKVVDNMVEARDLLDVGGSFSLNVKAGLFKAGASGEYLADTYNRENTVEVAIKATYQTVTEQLPADAKPIDTWRSFGNALGTHFVRSITYGGQLIAGVRMVCNNTRDKQKIKAGLEIGGQIEIFDLGVEVEGEYFKDLSKSVESSQIKIFSSVPLSVPPVDMQTLKKTLDTFPSDIEKFNGGRGVPLKMELWPLSRLDSSMADTLRNRELEAKLEDFERKFDDLLNAKSAVSDWLKVMGKPLSDEQEKKAGDFYSEIQKTIRPFYDVIGSLDTSKGSEQLKPADDAYGKEMPGAYFKKYLLLRQEIAEDQGAWVQSRGNGVTYTHWGRANCSHLAEQVAQGEVIGPKSLAGGSNFLCLSTTTEKEPLPSNKKSPILTGTSFEYPTGVNSLISCSVCRFGAKGSVQAFPGKTSCPPEWGYVYDGLLMSGSGNTLSTNFVCLDQSTDGSADVAADSDSPIVPNWLLAANGGSINKLVPCVVCAK